MFKGFSAFGWLKGKKSKNRREKRCFEHDCLTDEHQRKI